MLQSIKHFIFLLVLSSVAAYAAEPAQPQATLPRVVVTISKPDGHFAEDQPTCKKVAAQLWKDNKKALICFGTVFTAVIILTAVRLTPDSQTDSSFNEDSLNVYSMSTREINEKLNERTKMPTRSLHGKKQTRAQLKLSNRIKNPKKNFR